MDYFPAVTDNFIVFVTTSGLTILKDAAHQTIYMWLRAEYNEREYLKNPDAGDNYIASFSMDSWCWWKPLVTCLNVTVTTGLVLWAVLLVVGDLMKNNNVVNNKEEEK